MILLRLLFPAYFEDLLGLKWLKVQKYQLTRELDRTSSAPTKFSTLAEQHLFLCVSYSKELWTNNIILRLFSKKIEIFISLDVFQDNDPCSVLTSNFTYFWRNIKFSSSLYFSKLTQMNTLYSNLWDTLKMLLFANYLIKWKWIGKDRCYTCPMPSCKLRFLCKFNMF